MQLSSQARKAVATGLAVSTLMWSAMIAVPMTASAAVHSDGCLVLSGGVVWLITGGTRRGFTSAEVFSSHGHNFSQVVTASAEDAALPVGPIMTYADGTLVKGPNDPLVYLVAGGQKRPFVSGSVFTGLGYKFSNIQQAPVNTFQDLPTGGNLDSTTVAHPQGTVVNASGAFWLMTAAGRMGFPSAAVFTGHGYSFAKVVTANSYDLALADQGAVQAKAACTGGGGPTPPPTGGAFSVSLASSNPASSTLVETQSLADLAHFNVMGSGTINSIVLQRTGVSADSALEDIFLFDGSVRVTDSATPSSTMITFSGLNIPVSGSKTISVKSDIADSTAGQTVGVKTVSINGNAVSVSGNMHTIADNAGIATVSIASATGTITEAGSAQTIWGGTLSVNTNNVTLTRLALRQVGTIPSAEINNFKLLVDGIEVASSFSLDSNGYVTFSTSKLLTTGSRLLRVNADVVGGSNRTVEFDLRASYDLSLTDAQFNVGVEPTGSFPFGPASSSITAGSMTVVKDTTSATGNITNAANDVSLGKFTFTAFGEPIKVETLLVDFAHVTSGDVAETSTLRNGRVLVNGSQVGSTTTLNPASTGTSFTTNFVVNPGTPATVEVRADIFDNDGTNAMSDADKLTVTLSTGSSNAVRQSSLGSINVPSANTSANQVTVDEGSLSMAQTSNYSSHSIVDPKTAYKIASYQLSGSSTEAVTVNTFDLDVAVTDNGAGSPDVTDITDVYIKYGTSQTSIKSTVSATGNTWSPSFTLAVNQTMQIDVYATVGSDFASTDTIIATLEISGTTVQSSTSVTTSTVAGQTITIGTGSITGSEDASSPTAQLVTDGGTVVTAAYKFVTANDSYVITDVGIDLASAASATTVVLKDGSTVLGTKSAATSMIFSGLSVPVASNSTKVLTVEVTLGTVGVGAGASGTAITTTLDVSDTLAIAGATGTSAAVSGSDDAGSAMYVYASTPTISKENLASTTLLNTSNRPLLRFKVDANGGTVGWSRLFFEVSKDTDTVLASATLWDVTGGGNTQVAGTASHTTTGAASTSGTIEFDATAEQQISSSKTYELRGTVTLANAAGDFITVNMSQEAVYAAPTTAAAVEAADADATIIWSDLSAQSHAVGTSDWSGDYGVKNLPVSDSLNWPS